MHTAPGARRALLPLALIAAAALPVQAQTSAYTLSSLNAPLPNLVPADGDGSVVVRVTAPTTAQALAVALLVNGREVSGVLQADGPEGQVSGRITGLLPGDNLMRLTPRRSVRAPVAQLLVVRALAPQADCASLAGRTVPAALLGEPTSGATVTSATAVAAAGTVAAYCRVLADIAPASANAPTTKVQVNLPTAWSGKKLQLGGGGFNGTLVTGLGLGQSEPPDTVPPLTRGFMTAGTDSGHQTATNVEAQAFALNDEAFRNYAYASYKNTHDFAVQMALAYYGRRPGKSFYNGSSEGGREGLMMAQRYPDDFDAILSNDPVINFTALQTAGNAVAIAAARPAGTLNATKLQLAMDAVLARCDAIDGIADKVVAAFDACRAGPGPQALASLRCPSGGDEGNTCLSDAQLQTFLVSKNGVRFDFPLANGLTAYAGWEYGQENTTSNANWLLNQITSFGGGVVRYFIAQDAAYNALAFNPNDYQARVQQVSALMDATNPDLRRFLGRGGKLIVKEDMADAAQGPRTGLDYARNVIATVGADLAEAGFRAYQMPGLPHSSAGVAAGTANAPPWGVPGRISWLDVLTEWVDNGVAPADRLVMVNKQATAPFAVLASRPLCRYPNYAYAHYTGADAAGGADAANYTCVTQVPAPAQAQGGAARGR